MRIHVKTSAFTPYLPALWDFIQTFDESHVCLLKSRLLLTSCMLKLDESCPEPTCCIVDLKRGLNHLFGLSEEPVSQLKHYCLKVDLPFRFYQSFCLCHYLSGSHNLPLHFKEFGVLKKSQTLLLLRYFQETSLNEFPRLREVTNLEL